MSGSGRYLKREPESLPRHKDLSPFLAAAMAVRNPDWRNPAICRRHGSSRQFDSIGRETSTVPGFMGADSMPAIATDLISAVPSIVPSDIPAMSDDECLVRLARAIEEHDSEHLDEVARLIGRLAVTIE